jgi:hypothetical protein
MHEPLSQSLRTIIADTTDPAVRHVLHRDYETRGPALLKRVGTHRYAADPSAEVLCCAFAIDDEPVKLWIPGDPVPPGFIEAAADPSWIVCAHNDGFETARSWRRASPGRRSRLSAIAARWPWHRLWDYRRG